MGHIFISYSHKDRDYAHRLQDALQAEGFEVWIDDRIDYGDEWPMVIQDRLDACDAFILVATEDSYKSKWVQKEVTRAQRLDKPFFPLLLSGYPWLSIESTQYVDVKDKSLPPERFYKRLAKVSQRNKPLPSEELKPQKHIVKPVAVETNPLETLNSLLEEEHQDLHRFIEIPGQKDSKVAYPFWIGKYPVTNEQYERFLNAPDFANPVYWLEFPKFDENCEPIGDWGKGGLDWLQGKLKKAKSKVLSPSLWDDKDFGKSNPNNPVVGISYYEACAYCAWLFQNWDTVAESKANSSLKPHAIRLPLENEWTRAAGGEDPAERYPWDETGKSIASLKEIIRRANILESGIGHTTPVNAYELGRSLFGVVDMSGNVWEWQANYTNFKNIRNSFLRVRGGSWKDIQDCALVAHRRCYLPYYRYPNFGFRVCLPSD